MELKEFPLVRVEITRNKEGMRFLVPEHEFDVLRAMHGDINCVRLPADENDDEVVELDPNAEVELARLTRRYTRTGREDPVKAAFPNGGRNLVEFGFVTGVAAEETPKSGGHNHAKPKKKAAAKK